VAQATGRVATEQRDLRSLEHLIDRSAAAARYTYTGIALVDPALVAPVRAGEKAQLAPLLRAAAALGQLSGELHAGLWRDIGTADRLAGLEALLRDAKERGT